MYKKYIISTPFLQTLLESIERLSERLDILLKSQFDASLYIILFLLEDPNLSKTTDSWQN